MNYRDEILKLYPGSKEMPDASGAPSADYCIVRPATKDDWPENKWVCLGPYVSGDPWKAAWDRIKELCSVLSIEEKSDLDRINSTHNIHISNEDIVRYRELMAKKDKIKEFLEVCDDDCNHPYCWSQKERDPEKHEFVYGGYEVGSGGDISCKMCGKDIKDIHHIDIETAHDGSKVDIRREYGWRDGYAAGFRDAYNQPEHTFDQWWDIFIQTYGGSGEYWVLKGMAKKAWNTAK